MSNLRGPATRVVDLGGQTLLPGFVDAHAHIWKIGHLLTTMLDVRGVESLADLGARVRGAGHRLPDGAWLLRPRLQRGHACPTGAVPPAPTSTPLVADRPVVLTRTCGHIYACNCVALERAGITATRRRRPAAKSTTGRGGEPTGVLRETAMGLITEA